MNEKSNIKDNIKNVILFKKLKKSLFSFIIIDKNRKYCSLQ